MISPIVWLSFNQDVRQKLAKKFNLTKSGGAEVVDNKVYSDGYTPRDLAEITIDKMQRILLTNETDFYKLLEKIVEEIDGEPIPEDKTQVDVFPGAEIKKPKKKV